VTKQRATILVIDDDKDILVSAKMLLKQEYDEVITANNPNKINTLISTQPVDLILLDMNFRVGYNDGKEGIYWLKHVLEINPEIVVILMTAFGEIKLAVEAIKAGAFDFILKPWVNEKLLATVHAALVLRRSNLKLNVASSSNKAINEKIDHDYGPMIGSSAPMRKLMDTVKKVSVTDAEILVLGENGTGKQHLAREIHRLSPRREGPFIHVDLGAIPETLFEGELFGHKKGAFTDAREDKPSRFEMADGGTLFLDEIGNLPLHLQTKLLTVLQEKKVIRLGESIYRDFDVRLIFATNAPIHQWVKEGKFRQDLLFRINTIEVVIPPLRERNDDIAEFVDFFMDMYRKKYRKPHLSISGAALEQLKAHHWPGNIRELQHIIERGVIMSDGIEIKAGDFNLSSFQEEPPEKAGIAETDNLNLQEIEKLLVQKALDKYNGNISKAARELGLTRAALYRRMEKFNL
jgi:DNA-binding NtrC family response regulator